MKSLHHTLLLVIVFLGAMSPRLSAQSGTAIPFASAESKTFTLTSRAGINEIKFLLDAPIETIKGTAHDIKGTLTINPQHIEIMRGTITVGTGSLKTGVSLRDNHMLNADWLDAAQYPTITCTIEKCIDILVKQLDAASGYALIEGKAVGSFTLHGVTKPIVASFSMTYNKNLAPSGESVSVRTQFSLPWKDYGIKGRKGLANMTVGETAIVTATLSGQ